jgi:hypothetical protein
MIVDDVATGDELTHRSQALDGLYVKAISPASRDRGGKAVAVRGANYVRLSIAWTQLLSLSIAWTQLLLHLYRRNVGWGRRCKHVDCASCSVRSLDQGLVAQVCITLRRLTVRVAEDLLDLVQTATRVDQEAGEGVA